MNPYYGRHGWIDADGDTAKQKRRRIVSTREVEPEQSLNHCPSCGRAVRWETDGRGSARAVEGRRVHVCELGEVLAHVQGERGTEILELLRRAMNERRMYGEAV
jgi:hypothetical protein